MRYTFDKALEYNTLDTSFIFRRSGVGGGIARGATQGLGLQSLALDLDMATRLRVQSDASAAIGMCRRRGIGTVRHIAVSDLWAQERMKSHEFTLEKLACSVNPAGMLTNDVDKRTLMRLLHRASLYRRDGGPDLEPERTHSPTDASVLVSRRHRRVRRGGRGS